MDFRDGLSDEGTFEQRPAGITGQRYPASWRKPTGSRRKSKLEDSNPKQGASLLSEASGRREAGVTDANKQMNQKVVEDEAEKETCMPSGGLHSKMERFEHANDVI